MSKALRGLGEGLASVGMLGLQNYLAVGREETLARLRADYGIQQADYEHGKAVERIGMEDKAARERDQARFTAEAGENEKQRQFEAGKPGREAAADVAKYKGLYDLAQVKGIEVTRLPGMGGSSKGSDSDDFQSVMYERDRVDPITKEVIKQRVPLAFKRSTGEYFFNGRKLVGPPEESGMQPVAETAAPAAGGKEEPLEPTAAAGATAVEPSATDRALTERRYHDEKALREAVGGKQNPITEMRANNLRASLARIDQRMGRAQPITPRSGQQAMQRLKEMRERIIQIRSQLGGLVDPNTRRALGDELRELEHTYFTLKPRQVG